MRRGSKIALLVVGGSVVMLFSAAAAFLIGHGVGASERLAANKASRSREQNTLAAMNMTKTVFESWSLVCRDSLGDERRCVLFTAAADPNASQAPLTFSVASTPKGTPVLIVDTPPDVAVEQGVTVTPGAGNGIKLVVQSCGPQRCRAITELNSLLQAALETADTTRISYARENNLPGNYNLPTRGFRDGLAAWSKGSELRPPRSAVGN